MQVGRIYVSCVRVDSGWVSTLALCPLWRRARVLLAPCTLLDEDRGKWEAKGPRCGCYTHTFMMYSHRSSASFHRPQHEGVGGKLLCEGMKRYLPAAIWPLPRRMWMTGVSQRQRWPRCFFVSESEGLATYRPLSGEDEQPRATEREGMVFV